MKRRKSRRLEVMTGKYERVRDYFVGPKGVFLIKHMNKEKGNGFNICNISL